MPLGALNAAGEKSGVATASAASSSTVASTSAAHSLRTRDITLRIPSKDHLLQVSFCSTRHLLRDTILRHGLLQATHAHMDFLSLLGTQLSFTNLLACQLKGEERVAVRLTGEEATIVTEALALGECRCYLRPTFNAELADAGQPTFPLKVDRILYRQERPFVSCVNANLEELLMPPSAAPAEGVSPPARDGEVVPYTLYPSTFPAAISLDTWKHFFAYNATLHAYNYFRRSDGTVAAVWIQSDLQSTALREAGFIGSDGSVLVSQLSEEDAPNWSKLSAALQSSIRQSFGAIVTPLAAGAAVERRVGKMNRAVVEMLALLTAPRTSSHVDPVVAKATALLDVCNERHTTCQHVLSLLTGDYDGAYTAAVAARQYSQDPSQVAATVEPLRQALDIADWVIPLATADATRTGLDFFCRCSKDDIGRSIATAPPAALEELKRSNNFACSFCGKVHHFSAEEWAAFEQLVR